MISVNSRKIRIGMVGGGPGAFVGRVHRKAIAYDERAELVSGSFSSKLTKSQHLARDLFLDQERIYGSYEEMAEEERVRDDGIDIVVIVTPNHLHYPVAKSFLEAGINVVCEKPLAMSTEESQKLINLVEEKDLIFAVTYTYTGYPLIKEARKVVQSGSLGEINIVMAEYPQDGFSVLKNSNKWRLDSNKAGSSFCIGDIGTHVENLTSYVTGLKIDRLLANLGYYLDKELEDDAQIMLEYDNGAHGIYWASKVAVGGENPLRLRVFGSEGSLEWEQEFPDRMKLQYKGQPVQIITRGSNYDFLSDEAREATNLPPGHPEGYIEAFSNIYSAIFDHLSGSDDATGYPDVYDGFQGVKFIEKCIESEKKGSTWIDY